MAKKFYVVWAGRQTGVFTDWDTTRGYVDKFAGARFKAFPTRAEAELAFKSGRPVSTRTSRSVKTAAAKAPAKIGSTTVDLQIYCDGACEPNPGHAGSGIAVYRGGLLTQLWYGLYNPAGTNNTAELNALHHALLMAEQAVRDGQTAQVLSDSTYSINCISKWAMGWEKKGWRKKEGDIKNLDLIKAAYAVYTRIQSQVPLIHVSAHVGTEGNELADRMSILAVERQEPTLRQYEGEIDIPALLRMRAG